MQIKQDVGFEQNLVAQEKSVLIMCGERIELEFKPIKNMHLSVYPPEGRIHISAPIQTSQDKIRLYILQKWPWIVEKRNNLTRFTRQSARQYVSGEEHFWRGKSYRLKVVPDTKSQVIINGDYIELYVRDGATLKTKAHVLDSWYKADLNRILQDLVDKWQAKLHVQLDTWQIEKMAARWGSCCKNKRKALFNLELAKKPYHCVEYVVAHELAHLVEENHNDKFQNILFANLPNWQSIRKELNEFTI